MAIKTLYLEEELTDHPQALSVLSKFPGKEIVPIRRVEDVFGRVKKPYLQKRDNLSLFIGKKRGTLVKKAPPAYGQAQAAHYYFIHFYNCIYECEYCYLQDHFQSPDLVAFVNHEDIVAEIKKTFEQEQTKNPHREVWFHGGEFSDSLALASITGELDFYWPFFEDHPMAKLELRTKSASISPLLKFKPSPQIFISFGFAPQEDIDLYEHKTASLEKRISAAKKLTERGHQIGIHFDPIIIRDQALEHYKELASMIFEKISVESIAYLSLGVVRFPGRLQREIQKNYPRSSLLAQEFQKGEDQMLRFPRPLRLHLLKELKAYLMDLGLREEKIYLCMERES